MGITYIEATVVGPKRKKAVLDFLVDSGAKYTVLPRATWKSIGLKPERRLTFVLADGTRVQRDISECYISLPQGKTHTPVVLGERDDAALLGVVTLEELALVFNPFERSLHPARMMMA